VLSKKKILPISGRKRWIPTPMILNMQKLLQKDTDILLISKPTHTI
jgi:hypothetical protein